MSASGAEPVAGRRFLEMAAGACLAISLTGCASNLTLSDAIVFGDQFEQPLHGTHFIRGGIVSANYTPGATSHGANLHSNDSLGELTYLDFNPGPGGGLGLLTENFAAAATLQFLMIGCDVTFRIGDDLFFTGNATTSGSWGLAALQRVNTNFAAGPFYRLDRYTGFVRLFERPPSNTDYFAGTFGAKGDWLLHTYPTGAGMLFVCLGYSPTMESSFFSLGVSWVMIN